MIPDAWTNALIGGVFIGFAASVMLVLNGRICGISGIFFGAFKNPPSERVWRLFFLIGLIGSGLYFQLTAPEMFANESGRSLLAVGIAGLCVGFGTRLGSGCTSGHGVCGIGRMSVRSVIATVTFIASGAVAVAVMNLISGGQ